MKPLMAPGLARLFSRGLIVASVLTGGALLAGEDAGSSTTQGAGAAKLEGTDAGTFIHEANDINNAEVALGKLAQSKSQTAEVKEFGRMMVKDHTAANEQLRPIAQAHGVTVSDTVDSTHQKVLDKLEQQSGSEFDQQFMKVMLKGHQSAIAKFEKAAQQSQVPDVKEYAQNTLPILRQHMTHAKQTASVVGIDQQTISSLTKESSAGGTGDETHRDTGTYTRPDWGTKPGERGGEMPK
jgi:putative membrane protein